MCHYLKDKYELKVLGLYNTSYQDLGYQVIDALETSTGELGMQKLVNLVETWKPDYVIILNSPLIVSQYSVLLHQNCIYRQKVHTEEEKKTNSNLLPPVLERVSNTQVLGYICVGNEIMRKDIVEVLNRTLDKAFVPTEFALQQLKNNNFTKPLTKVGFGGTSSNLKLHSKKYSRDILGISENAFVIYSGYCNQPDKRIDILLKGYLDFLKKYPDKEIILMLNCGVVGTGWDIPRLYQTFAEEIGIKDWGRHLKLTVAHNEDPFFNDQTLSIFYSAADVGVCTSHGEFFGFPSVQLAGYGCPQLVPNFAALGELFQKGGIRINPVDSYVEPVSINLEMGLGKAIRKADLTRGLEIYYTNTEQLKKDGLEAKELVTEFSWESSVKLLDDQIKKIESYLWTP
jgi:glycosyltransferase involved in cell wall biosynthesis